MTARRVLVAFSSPHGSTRGIAERIAARLREAGLEADLSAEVAGDPGAYDTCIVGSAIHNQDWLAPAAAFLRRNLGALAERPVWLFSVSTVGDAESFFPAPVAWVLRRLRGDLPMVRGARRLVPVRGHLFLKALGGRYGDHRDWAAIDAWADSIGSELRRRDPAYS